MIEKIAHITDLHLDETFPFKDCVSARKRFDNVLNEIENQNIKHIICTGDIGENEGVEYFFEKLKSKNLNITLGNHDRFTEVSKYYKLGADYASKKIYSSVIENNYKILFLDSSDGTIDDNQLNWLEQQINSLKPILIFMHHPVLGLELKVDEIGRLKNRNDVLSILNKAPVDVTIFCGHYHMDSFLAYKNVTQYITPAIAFQIKKSINDIEIDTTQSGYRIITLMRNKMSSEIKQVSNAD